MLWFLHRYTPTRPAIAAIVAIKTAGHAIPVASYFVAISPASAVLLDVSNAAAVPFDSVLKPLPALFYRGISHTGNEERLMMDGDLCKIPISPPDDPHNDA